MTKMKTGIKLIAEAVVQDFNSTEAMLGSVASSLNFVSIAEYKSNKIWFLKQAGAKIVNEIDRLQQKDSQ